MPWYGQEKHAIARRRAETGHDQNEHGKTMGILLAGMMIGGASAVLTLLTGGSFWMALLVYSGTGAGSAVAVGLVAGLRCALGAGNAAQRPVEGRLARVTDS